MNDKDIVRLENIDCIFEVDGKKYCALLDPEDPNGYVNFAIYGQVEGNIHVAVGVPDEDFDKVAQAYEDYYNDLNSELELDMLEGDF